MAPVAPPVPPAIAILGPTGSGKSALAMRIAARLPVELISVDSAQVYRGMDIGTAKPTLAERRAVPHHLVDIRDPEQGYSAGEFRADCLHCLHDIAARGRVPVLVGGTMLYFRALFQGIAPMPRADAAVRADINTRAARQGWPALHSELAHLDPDSAARIHPHDAQRIQRALEVVRTSGRPMRELWQEAARPPSFAAWRIGVLQPRDRGLLHTALAARLDAMMAAGFPEEVSKLLARGTLSAESPAMRMVGYRQLAARIGNDDVGGVLQSALEATRQLAKRQTTWLRSATLLPPDATVVRADPFDTQAMEQMLEALIKAKLPP